MAICANLRTHYVKGSDKQGQSNQSPVVDMLEQVVLEHIGPLLGVIKGTQLERLRIHSQPVLEHFGAFDFHQTLILSVVVINLQKIAYNMKRKTIKRKLK